MAKGNYIALQALKPTELKVADYYKSFADDLIKRGDSDRAARAKMLEDQKKEVNSLFTKIDIKPFSTKAQMSDLASQAFIDSARAIGQRRMMAEKDPANAYKYLQEAQAIGDDYGVFATTFGSADFIKRANEKEQRLADNDVFGTTDENERLALTGVNMPIMQRNPQTGLMEFYLPKNGSATPDEPMVKYSAGEIVNLFTSNDEVNLLRSNKSNGNNGFLDKQIYDVAKLMSDEYSRNFDGNRTNAKKWFSTERGGQWFDTNFGVYNPNKVNPIVSQYARETLGRDISSEEDFNIAKQGIIGNIASLVGTETKVDTKDSALDIALQKQRLVNLQLDATKTRQDIANPNRGKSEGEVGILGNGTVTVGDVILNIPYKSGKNTGVNNYKVPAINYYVTGNTNDGRNSRIGVSTYWNPNGGKDGKGAYNFALNIPSLNGKDVVIENAKEERVKQVLSSNKVKNTENVLALMKTAADSRGLPQMKSKLVGKNNTDYNVSFGTETAKKEGKAEVDNDLTNSN